MSDIPSTSGVDSMIKQCSQPYPIKKKLGGGYQRKKEHLSNDQRVTIQSRVLWCIQLYKLKTNSSNKVKPDYLKCSTKGCVCDCV